jgi:undecaprenyl diphosphate synthase
MSSGAPLSAGSLDARTDEPVEALLHEVRARGNLPRHVAVIMDGNGRWATRRGLPRVEGHRAAVESVRQAVRIAGDIPVDMLTLFAFSTENWKRPQAEVNALMALLELTLRAEREELNRSGVRLRMIGERSRLPRTVAREFDRTIDYLSGNTGLLLTVAINYSGRYDLTQAVRGIAEAARRGALDPGEIREETVTSYLETRGLPDPDLLIRTSGEQRVSNFMLWQLAYTEIVVTPVLWPDFRKADFLRGIQEYQARERRFGRVPAGG